MDLQYTITPDDYVAFNQYFVLHNKQTRRNLMIGRIQGALIIFAAGMLVAYLRKAETLPTVLVFGACALLYFLLIPRYYIRNMGKRVKKMLETASKTACGEKTLTLEAEQLVLSGEGENSAYAYTVIEQIAQDTAHYYLYVGPMEALLVPFSAFADDAARQSFYQTLQDKLAAVKAQSAT